MKKEETSPPELPATDLDYEAPAIETVVTSSDMEREVHYAGQSFSGLR